MAENAEVQENEVVLDDDLEIEVVDDSVDESDEQQGEELDPEGEATDEEIAAYGSRAQKRINKLVWERHEERRRREAQERMANEAITHLERLTKENQRLVEALDKGRGALADQAKKRAELAITAAEAKLKKAYEEGNPEMLSSAQRELTDAQIALRSAPGIANSMVPTRTKDTEEAAPARPQPQQQEIEVDPKAKDWYQRNPWFNQDVEMTSFAYGVHEKLIRSGVDPNSDDYYNSIDRRMKEVFPDRFEGGPMKSQDSGTSIAVDTPSQGRKPSSPVARATRSSGQARGKIKLTETQVRIAKRLGVPLKEYAKQVLAEQQKIS